MAGQIQDPMERVYATVALRLYDDFDQAANDTGAFNDLDQVLEYGAE